MNKAIIQEKLILPKPIKQEPYNLQCLFPQRFPKIKNKKR